MSEELSRLRNWAQGRARPSTGAAAAARDRHHREPAQAGNLTEASPRGAGSRPRHDEPPILGDRP